MNTFKAKLLAKKQADAESKASQPRGRKSSHKVPKDYVPPPFLDEFDVPLKGILQFQKLMKEHRSITIQQSELNADKAAITEEIKKLCKLYNIPFFQYEGLQAKLYKVTRTTIKKGLLLAAGVSPITIIKATDVKTSESLKISEVGAKEEEEDYEP